MRRAAIFAHYDKDKIIDEYVIYYLKALKECVSELVFVSCNELSETEKSKLDGIADFVIAEEHDEYDFGSYKRGYFYLKERLKDFDELVFANDSCYGPLFLLKDVFDRMETCEKCDFWGITRNKFGVEKRGDKFVTVKRPHLQSYFVVFKQNVFTSEVFNRFMNSIKHCEQKNDIIINYEIGLTEILLRSGFSCSAYVKDYYRFNHVLISLWHQLVKKCKSPFVKCSVLRLKNEDLAFTDDWEEFLEENTDYPVTLISENLKRTAEKSRRGKHVPVFIKKIYYTLLTFQPAFTKKILILIYKRL